MQRPPSRSPSPLAFTAALALKFDEHGLLPAVVQDHLTGEIRMVGHANAEAIEKTLSTGRATFWSRSRGELWEKGATSGNAVTVHRVLIDCDADCVVYSGEPQGPTCHTGATSCFFRMAFAGEIREVAASSQTLLGVLEAVLESRKASTGAKSYTKSLYDGGAHVVGGKIREEASELAQAIAEESDERVVAEAADALYHLLVGLTFRGIPARHVLAELARRLGKSGHQEKAERNPKAPE